MHNCIKIKIMLMEVKKGEEFKNYLNKAGVID